ncbi:MAG: HAD-IIB family hydrolase [Gemmatimonadota bacterium]
MLASLDGLREAAPSIEGVVFDVDDTVTRAGRLEPEAFSAMWALAEAGLTLLCVTGRPLGWTDLFARLWPVALAVGENGAGWAWREGEGLREGYFQGPARREASVELLSRIRERAGEIFPDIPVAGDQRARRCDLAFDVGETHTVQPERIQGLVTLIETEGARSSVSSVHAHAVPGDWDKAVGAVRAARDALGLDLEDRRERWVFVGDSGNDAAAFAYFPHSVGVANVRNHLHRLPAPPRYVTAADRGRGFAEVARALLEARDGGEAVGGAAAAG